MGLCYSWYIAAVELQQVVEYVLGNGEFSVMEKIRPEDTGRREGVCKLSALEQDQEILCKGNGKHIAGSFLPKSIPIIFAIVVFLHYFTLPQKGRFTYHYTLFFTKCKANWKSIEELRKSRKRNFVNISLKNRENAYFPIDFCSFR